MNADDLLDLIGEAPEEQVRDAKADSGRRMPRRAKWFCAVAACLVLAIGVGGVLLPNLGGSSSAGGSGHDGGSVFMSYAGPVLPLTLTEENDQLSARRSITMDFASWVPLGRILVTDSYTLTNTGDETQTVSLLYPFVSSLYDLEKDRPRLFLGGETLETELHAGSYAGGFQGAWENWGETKENPGSLNLLEPESWEDYRELLSDGTYLRRALGEFPDLSNIPVTVYEFTDPWGPEKNDREGIPNPTIRVMFTLDYEKTTVLSYGFNAGYHDSEKGLMGRGFSIEARGPHSLIVIGDDIGGLSTQGYVTGGWDTKQTIEAGVTVTRRETDLEEALRQAAGHNAQALLDGGYDIDDFELYYGLLKEHLMGYGALSGHSAERYDSGTLEDLDVVHVDRVFWLEARVTVPPQGSVTVSAGLEKRASYDFHCAATKNQGISGYDLVTGLGSNLSFTEQTARLDDRGQIEIVRQNFGFDLEKGVTCVTLDLNEPHYYLEVRKPQGN